jgi:hypothetical protein
VCVCVNVCVCVCIKYVVGMLDSKNIFTLHLKFIQIFSGVNKYTLCRQIFKHSTTQHTDSGFFIYTEGDMLQ